MTFKDKLTYHNNNTNGRKYDVKWMDEQTNALMKAKKTQKNWKKFKQKPKYNKQWKSLQKSYKNVKENIEDFLFPFSKY